MRKLLSKVKLSKVRRVISGAVATALATAAMPLAAFAEEMDAVKFKTDGLDISTIVGKLFGFLLLAGQLIGGGIFIYALISFGLSIAQENPDQRARAIMFAVAGVFLLCIRWVLQGLGVV